jgi:diguanylate cyclase (GGDEF)-like protein
MAPLVALAATGTLARREAVSDSPRDPVTGLYNRSYLEAALEQLIALRRREPVEARPPLSMVMFDIDAFATINERHGRHVGDHVLRSVATVLRQRFRASDIVARVGDDSFVVVLNGADSEIAAETAAQIRRQVRELSLSNSSGEAVSVTLAAGYAIYREGDQVEELYRSAETALETGRWATPAAAPAAL